MYSGKSIFWVWLSVLLMPASAAGGYDGTGEAKTGSCPDTAILETTVTAQYLKQHLKRNVPRLILTPAILRQIGEELENGGAVTHLYSAIRANGRSVMSAPLLEYKKTGKRLLAVSREMLYRVNILGMLYAVEKDPQVLARINREVTAVCNFTDWNPSHFLDVAEMSMAVALALDWTMGKLPRSTIDLAKTALIEKGIKPGNGWWVRGTNNWNQVCNGGMIAASLAIADQDPGLAAETISRSLKGMPFALEEYAPDGVYPEGPSYWQYGTVFSALTSSMLKSALGTDFGLSAYQPLRESALFYLLSIAPSGHYYNFSDCGLTPDGDGDLTLAWFAAETGNAAYFDRERFPADLNDGRKLSRFAGAGLIWLTRFKARDKAHETPLPLSWKGSGPTPVVFFRGGKDDPAHYYFGAKGGQGNHSHGNMDAGSFIFELNGVRWVVDPGTQNYYEVEKTGFDLWGMCQHCDRWKLLTKNNFGHSTITVNDAFFKVNGFVPILDFKAGDRPEATMDMTALYDGNVKRLTRRFVKPDGHSLLIEDRFKASDSTKMITWQLITRAGVTLNENGAILRQDGKALRVEVLSPSGIRASVISLDPPPLKIDQKIARLKRVEFRIPAWTVRGEEGVISVRLSGESPDRLSGGSSRK